MLQNILRSELVQAELAALSRAWSAAIEFFPETIIFILLKIILPETSGEHPEVRLLVDSIPVLLLVRVKQCLCAPLSDGVNAGLSQPVDVELSYQLSVQIPDH